MSRVIRQFFMVVAIGTWSTVLIAAMPVQEEGGEGDSASCTSDSDLCVCSVANTDCECHGGANHCGASCASGGSSFCAHRPV